MKNIIKLGMSLNKKILFGIIYLFIITQGFTQNMKDTIKYRNFGYLNAGIENNYENININGIELKTNFKALIMGFGLNHKISENLNIRIGLNAAISGNAYKLIFINKNFTFNNLFNYQEAVIDYNYTGVQIPVNFIYKFNKIPFYSILGIKYITNISKNIGYSAVKINQDNLTYETGIGYGFKAKYSNIYVNLSYSIGNNIFKSSNNPIYDVTKIQNNVVLFNFIVEDNHSINKRIKKKFNFKKIKKL